MTNRRPSPGLVAAILVVISGLIVWPIGNYPVGDEWLYARSLELLLGEGVVRILDFNPMTYVGHLAWGGALTFPFGFSFTLARATTLVMLAVELWAFLRLLDDLHVDRTVQMAAMLTLLVQPIHFFQSFQYATDVPGLAWTALAVLAYGRGLDEKTGSARHLLLGSIFGALAFLVRQPGILVVAAVGAYFVLFARARLLEPRAWLACFGVPAAAIAGWYGWYHYIHGATGTYRALSTEALAYWAAPTPEHILHALYFPLATVGSFLLPFALAARFPAAASKVRTRVAVLVVVLLVATFAWISFGEGRLFPYVRNCVTSFGFFTPNELLVGARVPLWPPGTEWVVSVAVLLATGHVLYALASMHLRTARLRLLALLATLQLAYLVATADITFDRHMLLLFPTLLALLAASMKSASRLRVLVYAPLTLLLLAYSLAVSHDWHAISRTAARASMDLQAAGIDKRFIDAGFSQTNYQMYEQSRAERAAGGPPRVRPGDIWYIGVLNKAVETRYVVSLSSEMEPDRWWQSVSPWARGFARMPRLEPYLPYARYSYVAAWPPGRNTLWVLRDTRTTQPAGLSEAPP